jgi:hypothetical protein
VGDGENATYAGAGASTIVLVAQMNTLMDHRTIYRCHGRMLKATLVPGGAAEAVCRPRKASTLTLAKYWQRNSADAFLKEPQDLGGQCCQGQFGIAAATRFKGASVPNEDKLVSGLDLIDGKICG